MQPRLFLGSSGESLPVLEKVKNYFEDVFDCILWTNAFTRNKSNLDSLIVQARMADFSILVAMKDDIVIERGETYSVARDNVIFEFGLFLGATGLGHSFMLAEEGIDLPSDLDGITIDKFVWKDGQYNSLDVVCNHIKKELTKVSESSDLGLLPSTALAIGYYYSFIKKVCEDIHSAGKIKTGDGADAKEIIVKDFKFHVIIPADLDDNGVEDFKILYNKKQSLKNAMTGSMSSTRRGYPFVFKVEPPGQNEQGEITIDLFDVPTTLNTLVHTIKLYMPPDQLGKNENIERLERRELANFAKALEFLISKNVSTKNHVEVKTAITVD
ncbi:STING domain-containing protein [Terrimonas alba]|uniref:STING domain-containing protein n=1 Tax=Terrimonas alba TaxID=3349636 RepID=UPI0035F25898